MARAWGAMFGRSRTRSRTSSARPTATWWRSAPARRLHIALLAAGVGPGDEVITPSFNNVADFQAILAVGADPVFCDIDPVSLCIDLEKAEELVSPRTRAIIVMDYDCLPVRPRRRGRLAARRGLRVIHDAAHSLGSRYSGRPVGSFSDIAMFSFDPVKTVTCIDGGAVVVRTEEELRRLREMRLIGMGQPAAVMYQNKRAWTFDVVARGLPLPHANMHAAIGLAQLGKLDVIASTRREACRAYNAALAGLPLVRTPLTDFSDVDPFLYYIRVPAEHRDALRDFLKAEGVDTGIHWQPGHWFSLFQECRPATSASPSASGRRSSPCPCTRRCRSRPCTRSPTRSTPTSAAAHERRRRPAAAARAEGRARAPAARRSCCRWAIRSVPCFGPSPPCLAAVDAEDVRCLTEWRNRHVKSFLTEFVAHDARTASGCSSRSTATTASCSSCWMRSTARGWATSASASSTGTRATARPTPSSAAARRRPG